MLVKKVMTKKVVVLKPGDTLGDAIIKFALNHISGAPVVERGKIVGIVSESDIIKTIDAYNPRVNYDTDTLFGLISAVIRHKHEFEAVKKEIFGSAKIKVKDFMVRNVITIGPNEKIEKAAKLMNLHNIKRLPVVTSKGKLVGIISRADIIRALSLK